MRLLPKSLLGQVMATVIFGLFVGQGVAAVLLFQGAQQRQQVNIVNSAAFRLVDARDRAERRERGRLASRGGQSEDDGRPRRGERDGKKDRRGERPGYSEFRVGLETSDRSPLLPGETRLPEIEEGLERVLASQGIVTEEVVALRRDATRDPFITERPRLLARIERRGEDDRWLIVAAYRDDSGAWRVARVAEGRRPRQLFGPILIQTLVIFAVLVTLLYFVMRRITRPIARLTDRVTTFSQRPDRTEKLEESGPQDVRELIAAHNLMEARISAMLDEKDVMLGAIGHDLKTPLAALRVRIESVPDDRQRQRMAESIEGITRTLDDILTLARVGRAGSQREKLDLSALASSVVEEFEDLGEPVTLVEAPRLVVSGHTTWLERAMRNLISNAVRYGGAANVEVLLEDGKAVIRVDDTGPGIPPDRISEMMEPFTRGEASRNRATGGAGLGLTLARAIAEQHGGRLVLANRAGGGLRAEIRLPENA